MKTLVLAVLAVLCSVVGAAAQSAESYRLNYYLPGASAPLQQSDVWTTASVQCGLPKATNPNTVNPTRVVWDDPANPTLDCSYTFPATGTALFALPVGQFEGTLVVANAAGPSPESNRAGFTKAAVPAARTGVRLDR